MQFITVPKIGLNKAKVCSDKMRFVQCSTVNCIIISTLSNYKDKSILYYLIQYIHIYIYSCYSFSSSTLRPWNWHAFTLFSYSYSIVAKLMSPKAYNWIIWQDMFKTFRALATGWCLKVWAFIESAISTIKRRKEVQGCLPSWVKGYWSMCERTSGRMMLVWDFSISDFDP